MTLLQNFRAVLPPTLTVPQREVLESWCGNELNGDSSLRPAVRNLLKTTGAGPQRGTDEALAVLDHLLENMPENAARGLLPASNSNLAPIDANIVIARSRLEQRLASTRQLVPELREELIEFQTSLRNWPVTAA